MNIKQKPLVTMGDTLTPMGRFCADGRMDFSARDVVNVLTEDTAYIIHSKDIN